MDLLQLKYPTLSVGVSPLRAIFRDSKGNPVTLPLDELTAAHEQHPDAEHFKRALDDLVHVI